jgi:hypothetical protein
MAIMRATRSERPQCFEFKEFIVVAVYFKSCVESGSGVSPDHWGLIGNNKNCTCWHDFKWFHEELSSLNAMDLNGEVKNYRCLRSLPSESSISPHIPKASRINILDPRSDGVTLGGVAGVIHDIDLLNACRIVLSVTIKAGYLREIISKKRATC